MVFSAIVSSRGTDESLKRFKVLAYWMEPSVRDVVENGRKLAVLATKFRYAANVSSPSIFSTSDSG